MRSQFVARIVVSLALGSCAWLSATSQSRTATPISEMEAVPVPSRVVARVDDAQRITLTGNTHPLARPQYDKGLLETGTRMERMMLVLKRSPEQEAALAAFNKRQYDPKSPDYHHWLHPEEFGKLYGPSDADMAAVTNWLQNRGFEIYTVSKGRTSIQFSGTSAQVQAAFQVEMHRYQVNGEQHIANDRDPQIPEALSPVVEGVASLHNFFAKPQSVFGKYVKRDKKTGKITEIALPEIQKLDKTGPELSSGAPLKNIGKPAPQLTFEPSGDTYPHEDLTPYDFATIYNILPAWNNKVLGTNVTVAISGVSDILASDVTSFRKSFGLSGFKGTFVQKANGTDPGADGGGGQGENTLDVEMAGATAPDANIVLIVSANTSTTGGDELSDEYIIDNEVAPIMSASYGECELGLGAAGNAAINAIWQKGMTAGISIFESSGDQGSAGCSDSDAAAPNYDQYGLQVNGIASSPYLTAVGGTDFTWSFVSGGPAKYWNTTNGAQLQSAKGYLPEVPWNSTCTNPLVYPIFSNGFANPEALCNGVIGTDYEDLIRITGGSGGVSHCTTGGTTNASCTGGYAKPTWQTGLGVPADSHRDLPDVSLFASDGFADGIVGSAILFCEASSNQTEKICDYTNPDYIYTQEIGGTSASSPLMAGIMALVVQKTGAAQGLANPVFYSLFNKQVTAGTACDSSTVTNASTCVFNDISSGTIAQVCLTGGPNCVTSTSGDQLGILSGYSAGKGYDLAVGLGSVNVTNLVNAWPTTAPTLTVSVSPTSLAFASTTVGSTSTAQLVTIKNTGTASVTLTSETLTGTNATSFVKSATTCTTTLAAGASCTVSVEFKPAAAGTLTASLSVADSATGSPQTVALTGTATAASTLTVTVAPATLSFGSVTVNTTSAAQVVTVTNTGTVAVTVTSFTFTGANATAFAISTKTCSTSLAADASCTLSIVFKPTVTGAQSATFNATDNATGSPQKVTLSGTGTAASTGAVAMSPTTLTFPATAVGATSATQVVTVTNNGTTAVTVSSYKFTGTNATSFVLTAHSCGTSIAAGASCTLTVAFKPAAAGALTATLNATDNAAGSPQTVALSGTGTAGSSGALTVSPTSIAFPATITGTTSDAQVVTLTNTGTTTVTINSVTLGGTNATSFIEINSCAATLAANASCSLYVAFKPATAAAKTATISIADTAAGSPQIVTLTGTGTAAPSVKLSVTSIAFPTTKSGSTSAAKAVTLTNSGTATLNLTSIALTGANPTAFVALDTCGATLAASASCTVYVAFAPTATSSFAASLTIADNGAASPQSVALTGTGD